ncbi:hypothetical protein [Candidimonas nitroreducens]|uniref:hypothetical protein n=1 Tax=Candidimonas nitroreducens TaxID=683354 RepID=UPI0011782380|nr:hypothetical protein [Candidimonas nitroreducens]
MARSEKRGPQLVMNNAHDDHVPPASLEPPSRPCLRHGARFKIDIAQTTQAVGLLIGKMPSFPEAVLKGQAPIKYQY